MLNLLAFKFKYKSDPYIHLGINKKTGSAKDIIIKTSLAILLNL